MLGRRTVVIFAAAMVVRVVYVLSIRHAFFFDHLVTESAFYDSWAHAIGSGDAPVQLPFDEAPGYAYFVALVYAIAGRSVLGVALVQALVGATTCAAIAAIANRVGGNRAGWFAGAIAALYGPFIYFTAQLEPATLAVCAASLAVAAMPSAGARPRGWILAGIAWAVAIVVRSELAIAVPFVIGHAWLVAGVRSAARVAIAPAILLAVSLAANTATSGHPVLLTNGAGVNLWLGNNPDADGVNPFVHGRLEAVVHEVEATTTDPVARDQAFRSHAELSPALLAKKLVWTFSSRELPNAADMYWQSEQSWLFHRPLFPLAFWLVLPLGLAGAIVLGRRWREHLVLLGPIAAALAACVVFFTNARFRLVMLPSVIVLAALALEPIARSVRFPRRDLRVTLQLAFGIVLGIVIAWPNYYDVAHFRIPQIDVNTGELELAAGHLESAELHLRSGLARDPDDASARLALERVLELEATHR